MRRGDQLVVGDEWNQVCLAGGATRMVNLTGGRAVFPGLLEEG